MRHGLLIGVSHFEDERLSVLNAPAHDVMALAEVLRWPLEWLQTRGVIVTQGLEVRCTLQS